MEEQNKKSGLKPKLQKAKAKFFTSFYNDPAKDLKIIAITGNSGRDVTAHFLQEIIKFQDERVGLIIDPKSTKDLYKQLYKIWKNGACYVIITLTSTGIANHQLYQLPIYMTVNTDGTPVEQLPPVATTVFTDNQSIESDARAILYNTEPCFNIINHDHPDFDALAAYPVKTATFSYGNSHASDLRIDRFKLYRKGTEANLLYGREKLDVATYLVGEASVPLMAAAALAGLALGATFDDIIDGIANYEPIITA